MAEASRGRKGAGPGPPVSISPLPSKPGVYRFHDASDRVLYIGRATSLRSRVPSFSRRSRQRGQGPSPDPLPR